VASNASDAVQSLLVALQLGDSFFPSGSSAFSWGLEALVHDAAVSDAQQLAAFITGQIAWRWATTDRIAIGHVVRSSEVMTSTREADEALDSMMLPLELRSGSCRSGAALLRIHERLGSEPAAVYRQLVQAGAAPGQLAAVQGLVYGHAGLAPSHAIALSGHIFTVSLLGAGIRLGLIGSIAAQRALAALRHLVARYAEDECPSLDQMHSFAPEADIAAMRHPRQQVRLFAN
jgi:urease accessory protein